MGWERSRQKLMNEQAQEKVGWGRQKSRNSAREIPYLDKFNERKEDYLEQQERWPCHAKCKKEMERDERKSMDIQKLRKKEEEQNFSIK